MNTSKEVDKIFPALLSAQKEMEGALKNSKNPHFKSNFADFNSVLDACKASLNNVGVMIVQPTLLKQIVGADGSIELVDILETTLVHADSGQFISAEGRIICIDKSNPQKWGSAVTYAKRYVLQALVVLPSEDDDGNSATPSAKPTPKSSGAPKPNGAHAPKKPSKPKPKL